MVLLNETGDLPEAAHLPANFTWTITGPLRAYATVTAVGSGSSVIVQPGRGTFGVALLPIAIGAGLFFVIY